MDSDTIDRQNFVRIVNECAYSRFSRHCIDIEKGSSYNRRVCVADSDTGNLRIFLMKENE